MLGQGIQALATAPWMVFCPGLAISLAVFGLNPFGDSIRDLTDPRLRGGLGSPRARKGAIAMPLCCSRLARLTACAIAAILAFALPAAPAPAQWIAP